MSASSHHGDTDDRAVSMFQVSQAVYVVLLIVTCAGSLFAMGPRLVFGTSPAVTHVNSLIFVGLYLGGVVWIRRRKKTRRQRWLDHPRMVVIHVVIAGFLPMLLEMRWKWSGVLRFFHLVSFQPAFSALDTNLSVPHQVTPLMRTILVMLFTTHSAACLFWYLAKINDFSDGTWVGAQAPWLVESSASTQYVYSLYFAVVTVSTVGYGDLSPVNRLETAWMVLYIFISIFLVANIVGVVSALAAIKDTEIAESRARIARFERMLATDHVSADVAVATRAYLRLSLRGLFSTCDVDSLPASVKFRIREERFGPYLRQLPLFSGVSDRFRRLCLAAVKEDSFVRGHDVVRQGDLETRLCIIVDGTATLEVDRFPVASLTKGACFGAEGFVSLLPQPWTISSRTLLRVVSLDEGDRDKLERSSPHDWALLRKNLVAMTRDIRRAASVVAVNEEGFSDDYLTAPEADARPYAFLRRGGTMDMTRDTSEIKSLKLRKHCMTLDLLQGTESVAFRQLTEEAGLVEDAVVRDAGFASQQLSARHCQVAASGDAQELQRLLDIVPLSEVPADYDGRTALHLACAEGRLECVKLLLDAGAEKDAVDRFGRTPLHEAVLNAKDDVIGLLRARNARLLLPRPAEILCHAASTGDIPLIRRYCDAGVDINATDYDKRSCLMLAAAHGNLPLCTFLLSRGANKFLKDRWGHAPFHELRRYGHDKNNESPLSTLLRIDLDD